MDNTIVLNDDQQAVYNAIGEHKSLFISGAAGVGKTHLLSYVVTNDPHSSIILCATTNQAARVLTKKIDTGIKVKTLHSVLKSTPDYDGSTKDVDEIMSFNFQCSAEDISSLKGKTLIIDEASMICGPMQEYITQLIRAGILHKVVYVGDQYQLPCVKDKPFDYSKVDKVIELTKIMRSQGSLMEYHQKIRSEVIDPTVKELSMFSGATFFDKKEEFVAYMKSLSCSKLVITHTNHASQIYSELLDAKELYVDQTCSSLSACRYASLSGGCARMEVTTNSHIIIDKIFKSYRLMKRDAMRADYKFYLPNEPVDIDIPNISYARIYNEDGDMMYISIWNGDATDKESTYLNKLSREYRRFQDRVRKEISNESLWLSYAKEDGYLKSLNILKTQGYLTSKMVQEENLHWNNFFAINQALPLRSIVASTAHRAQGMTVDAVGIDYKDISSAGDKRLLYVALTRAAKQLIIYTGEDYEK